MPQITVKRIFILLIAMAGFALIINILTESISSVNDEYISGSSGKIKYNDVKEYLSKIEFDSEQNREVFKKGTVNKYTLKFFRFLQKKFKNMDFDGHCEAVKNYLYSIMDAREAEQLFELYKKFTEYEKIAANELNNAGELKTTEDLLAVLKKMKSLQMEIFGKENAEIIFGAMMKAREYPIRRGGIINDSNLYSYEKEKRLNKLNYDMWGNEGSEVEKSRKPYVAYTETLSIYSKDISEMSDTQKRDKITEIRKSIFPPEVVQRLDEVDKTIEAEKNRDEKYKNEYSNIMNDSDLSLDEKNIRIRELQDKTYGAEAESVRRIENMTKGKEVFKKQYNIN